MFICFNAAVKSLAVDIIMSVSMAVGMMICGETKRQFFQFKLNWWQVSKFDGKYNVQDWGQRTIQRGHAETISCYLQGVHEEEL